MVVTQERFRLVHYDRSGTYVTPLFNIHSDKEVFIRFVLGLGSPEEERLGLDTSVQWTIDQTTGKKVAGTIKVRQQDEAAKDPKVVTYNLNMDEPPFVRPGIRGRGTTAWRATDPTTGEEVIIKDAWRTSARCGECEYLVAARGIPGVVQLQGYEDCCAETLNYRPPGFEAGHFQNRIKLRIVLKRYGPCITQFRSRLMLFRALRDAIIGMHIPITSPHESNAVHAGHRKLLERKVLHRDVSLQNILFGSADATEGDCGILIDLDMAVWADKWLSPVKADARIVSPALEFSIYISF